MESNNNKLVLYQSSYSNWLFLIIPVVLLLSIINVFWICDTWSLIMAMFIIVLILYNSCKLYIYDDVVAITYPFRPFRRQYIFSKNELKEIIIRSDISFGTKSIIVKSKNHNGGLDVKYLTHYWRPKQYIDVVRNLNINGINANSFPD